MKYDRPVWKIMHLCADDMNESVRYEDVRDWFLAHYPNVTEATIRAHLIGLTEGGRAKHVQFAQRSPVFRRLARGQYAPIPKAERGEDPDASRPSASRLKMFRKPDDGPAEEALGKVSEPMGDISSAPSPMTMCSEREAHVFDVILLGSVGERANVPAPAKEIFREFEFQLSRTDAEKSSSQWFVLSAEHGLVTPHEWITPDPRTLADMEPEYRVDWATWVVARLVSFVGPLEGLSIRVDAPDAFIGPLFADLQAAGAVVSSGNLELPNVRRGGPPRMREVLADVVAIRPYAEASRHLADPDNAVQLRDLSSLPESPGLYGWCVDPIGARVLNRCLRLPIRAGLLFVGQTGAQGTDSGGVKPAPGLRTQIEAVQLRGHARASTFKLTLATVLQEHLHMSSLDDPLLRDWMMQHLTVTVWPSSDLEELREIAPRVIAELNPPLNIDRGPAAEYRTRLGQMRGALG